MWNRGNEKPGRATGEQGDGGNRGHNAHTNAHGANIGAPAYHEDTKTTKHTKSL